MKILVDGVAFQSAESVSTQIWSRFLIELAGSGHEIVFLDRGGGRLLTGLNAIPFPSYTGVATSSDSLLLQRFCDFFAIDVFASTGFTTPTRTPSILVLAEFPEDNLQRDRSRRLASELELALLHASRIICLSKAVRAKLLARDKQLKPEHVVVAPVGQASQSSQGKCRTKVLSAPTRKLSPVFPWRRDEMAKLAMIFDKSLKAAVAEGRSRKEREFARDWNALRVMQAGVDIEVYADEK